jgi:CDP-diacylglycerol--serine O-phosphatidyltransferase
MRVPPELVLPVFVAVVFVIALLISYPWVVLSFGSIIFLLSLPIGWKSYRDQEVKAAVQETFPDVPSPADPPLPSALSKPPVVPRPRKQDNGRPSRPH